VSSRILVVADVPEAERLARWLEEAGLPARISDGGDDTVTGFVRDPAVIVVITATLALGDSLSLVNVLREETDRPLRVVLIGDERGPIRTALDAMEYKADRFLRWPPDPKALAFAVRSCLRMGEETRGSVRRSGGVVQTDVVSGVAGELAALAIAQAKAVALDDLTGFEAGPSGHGRPITMAGVAAHALRARLDQAVQEAISSYLQDAMEDMFSRTLSAVLDEELAAESAGLGLGEPAQAPQDELGEELVEELSGRDLVEELAGGGDVAKDLGGEEVGGEVQDDGDLEELDASDIEEVVPEELRLSRSRAEEEDALLQEFAAELSAEDTSEEPPSSNGETAEVPREVESPISELPMREPTQILSGEPRRATQPRLEAVPEASSPPTRPMAPENAPTGTFVRELRRHMSAIEQRLFGDTPTVEPLGDDDAEPEIDLDSIGVDTVPGLTAEVVKLPRGREPLPEVEDDVMVVDDDSDLGARVTNPRSLAPVPAARGDLREEDVAMLIARFHRERYSGRATFHRGEAQKAIYFEEGRPVFATSNLPHDRMGDLLYREGKITREQHARSREIVAETGRRMGEILVEMGFLKRRELLPAVRRHVEDIVYSLFAWDSGDYVSTPRDTAQDEKIRLAAHPTALVLEGIRRKMGLERLRARVGPLHTVIVPFKRDELMSSLAEADLSPDEREGAELIDGRRSLAEIRAASKLDETSIYHLAYGILALGLARAQERGREPTDSGRHPTGPGSTPSLGGAADVRIDRERVLAKHLHVLEADYFAVLGVRRDATAFEVRRAYESARRDYAVEAFPVEVQRELADPLHEIAVVLDEAFRVLRDDQIRRQYLSNLKD
jgi:ActR/RegA family two-component response regulator